MKFKEYVEKLNDFLAKYPKSGEFEVVSSSDDEGNEYNTLVFGPTIGKYDTRERSFRSDDDDTIDAVCIN